MISRQKIRKYCDSIAREFRPQKIILFGSYAYGRPTPDSDVDLLVIMPLRQRPTAKAIQIRQRLDAGFPLDLLVRTPQDIAWRAEQGDCFINEILTKGRVLYEASHS